MVYQYGDLLRRIQFLKLYPSCGFELRFQPAGSAYPFPHTFIGNHRCLTRKIQLGKFRYPIRSPPGRHFFFFTVHTVLFFRQLSDYNIRIISIRYPPKDNYLQKKKYILIIPYHPAASGEKQSIYYLCNVVQRELLITLTLKHLKVCQ